MEQELINFIKTEIEKFKNETIVFSEILQFFKQFDSQIELIRLRIRFHNKKKVIIFNIFTKQIINQARLNKTQIEFYDVVKDQVLYNLYLYTTSQKKENILEFLDQILSTHNFIINKYEKNN